jgi:beta-glucosidase
MSGRTYRYFHGIPLYPFGYGLSYTSFAYGNLRISDSAVTSDPIKVAVDVKNTGTVSGDEVVELYLSHPGLVGAPIRSLAGFQRVHLERGQTSTVTFTLSTREFSVVDRAGQRTVPSGKVELWVGGGQPVSVPGLPQPSGVRGTINVTKEMSVPD